MFDKSFNLVKEFKTIKDAANFVSLSPSSVSKYITKGTLWNDTYYFKIKEDKNLSNLDKNTGDTVGKLGNKDYKSYKLSVLDTNNKVLYNFNSLRKASQILNISRDSLVRYTKAGKLWNDKFKFVISK